MKRWKSCVGGFVIVGSCLACSDGGGGAADSGVTAEAGAPVDAATPPKDAAPADVATDAPAAPPPSHVMTADYWLSSSIASSCAKVAPYLTYIYPKSGEYGTYHACGIKTVAYMTPSMPQTGEIEYSLIGNAYADVRAKDCKGNVVTTYAGQGYLMDPHATDALAFYQATIDATFAEIEKGSGIEPDAIFSDNSDEDYGASATPCTWTSFGDWTKATTAILAKLDTHGAQLFLNDLSLPEAYSVIPAGDTVQNVIDSLAPAPVTGGEQEGFVYDLITHPDRWTMEVDTEIAAVAAHKVYWAYSNHSLANVDPTSAGGIAIRNYLYASFLLGYEPAHAIFQEWFNGTPSGFKVMPETGLVPMQPLQTAKSDVGELQRGAGGPFVREFASCYFRGVLVGPCAAVVNPSSQSVAVDLPAYAESVVLSGSDILDGGNVGFAGPKITTLGPEQAAILLP